MRNYFFGAPKKGTKHRDKMEKEIQDLKDEITLLRAEIADLKEMIMELAPFKLRTKTGVSGGLKNKQKLNREERKAARAEKWLKRMKPKK